MKSDQIRIVTAKAATKQDLCVTLAYVQDALDLAQRLKVKLENMPMAVRSFLEDKGHDLESAARAEFVFLQSLNYVEQLVDCV